MMFLNPFALLGLLALPILWIILRFIPPEPKRILLPSARFLAGLQSEDTTPQSTPWWLRALRLLILLCLIFAFAGPVLNPLIPSDNKGPLRLVYDNAWASAQSWDLQMAKAESLIAQAQKNNRVVQLIPTASDREGSGFTNADDALKRLKSFEPQPFPAALDRLMVKENADTQFISSGIADPGFDSFLRTLSSLGDVTVYTPPMVSRAGLLRGPAPDSDDALVRVEIPGGAGARSINLQAFDMKGTLINQLRQTVTGLVDGMAIKDEGGLFAHKAIAKWSVAEFTGAGGIRLEDPTQGTGRIGIPLQARKNDQSGFEDAGFYLTHAAEPFASVLTGTIAELIEQRCGVIVLPDIASFTTDDLDRLEKWTKRGGVLLRFGGPAMSESHNELIPVDLKTGMRSLSGDLSWGEPLKLAAFPPNSPFAGQTPPDITVERQLLAAPTSDVASHSWAQLADGTPVITARALDKGMVVLVHTTATPEWSDFVLSGFYVTFLKEIVELSAVDDKSATSDKNLKPFMVLDGRGQLRKPDSHVKSLTRLDLETLTPSADHPPGYYTDGERKFAYNLGDHVASLDAVSSVPQGVKTETLNLEKSERHLASLFFLLAMLLFLVDWLIRLMAVKFWQRTFVILALLTIAQPALAESNVEKAASIHLACVKNDKADLCRSALNMIVTTVGERTSSVVGEAVIVDLDKDDLSYYPILYWPVGPHDKITPAGRQNLQAYLYKGGMVLFDTQDGTYEGSEIVASASVTNLRGILEGFNVPLLKPAPSDFVLFKSFYLLNIYPEFDQTGKVWIEEDALPPHQGISSVMITGEDWMRKWAYPQNKTDEEMAKRFGVNLVMYALTGNYKTDQVHMNAILDRMGN